MSRYRQSTHQPGCVVVSPRAPAAGFTLVELVIVIAVLGALAAVAFPRLIDLRPEARQAAINEQAANLIAQDTLNVAACRVNADDCIEFSTTGFDNPGVCQDALASFLPEAGNAFEATTFASNTPRDEWADLPDEGEALFWATRTVEVDFPQTVPCVLSWR